MSQGKTKETNKGTSKETEQRAALQRRGQHRDHHAQPAGADERAYAGARSRAASRVRSGRCRPRRPRHHPHRRRPRLLRRLRPGPDRKERHPAFRPEGQVARGVHRVLAAQRRRPGRAVDPYVAAGQADHRGGQRLGHGRRLLVPARRRHHHRIGPGGVRAARGSPHLEHDISAGRAVRLEGGEPLGR